MKEAEELFKKEYPLLHHEASLDGTIDIQYSDIIELMKKYAQSCIDNSVRLCSCSEENYIGFTSINCCNTCGHPQEEFWINKQESNTDSHLESCNHEGQEIPSKTIVCKHCKEIVTTTSVVIGI